MKLFDSHCHLDDHAYQSDLEQVLTRAKVAGVFGMMIVGVNKKSSQKAVDLANSYPNCYAAVGVHPHDTKDCTDHTIRYLSRLTQHQNVQAWGEIGLDFNRMFSPRDIQEKWFISQLETALNLNLPIIFHERDTNGRLIDILSSFKSSNISGVMHCFSGNKKELFGYLDLGLYIGITGILTIKERGAILRSLVPLIPKEQLLIETDAPYLTPSPEKNHYRRNEPAFVKSVLLKLADVLNTPPHVLSETIWQNTCRLYRIEPVVSKSG